MNDKKIDLITQAVTACAECAQRTINEFALEVWVESLLALTDAEFAQAVKFLKNCIKEHRFPKITEVEQFARGLLSQDDTSQLVADLIGNAIVRFGLPNQAAAKAFCGELAWEVVTQSGGWASVCALESMRDLSIAKTQWRQTAKHVQQRALGGFLDRTPSLPAPEASRGPTDAKKLLADLGLKT